MPASLAAIWADTSTAPLIRDERPQACEIGGTVVALHAAEHLRRAGFLSRVIIGFAQTKTRRIRMRVTLAKRRIDSVDALLRLPLEDVIERVINGIDRRVVTIGLSLQPPDH